MTEESNTPLKPERLLPRREVEHRVGLGRSAIYARMRSGNFPQAIHDNLSKTVWWLESEIDAWIAEKVRQTRGIVGQTVGM